MKADIRLWKPGVMVVSAWWGVVPFIAFIVFVLASFLIQSWALLPALVASLLALLAGWVLHEAAHLAACRIFGLPARIADWHRLRGRRILPRSVAFSGAAPWWAYAIILAAPAVLGLLLLGLLTFHFLSSGVLWLGPISLLALAGSAMFAGAADDAARVLFLILHRPARVEESPDGHMFRPVGEAEWISVHPRHRPPRERRSAS
ncbi:MAG: metalloprotease family protein [Armatimonadota bacterium]|nr:metalloprotease family protein [Armatimonadota bacterium]